MSWSVDEVILGARTVLYKYNCIPVNVQEWLQPNPLVLNGEEVGRVGSSEGVSF